MSTNKDIAIQKIMDEYEKFSNLILQQLDLLEKILNEGSLTVPQEIYDQIEENEIKIDRFEVDISEEIINTIVLYQPVASELRKMIACYRITINMERIGDLVRNIVKYIIKIKGHDVFLKSSDLIENMLALSTNMVTKALFSFANNDKEYAIWAIKNDEAVDDLNRKLLKKAIIKEEFPDESKNILLSFINMKGIISDIERIADHATNIAEASIYAMEGKDIRHQKLDG